MPKTPIIRPISWLNASITIGVLCSFVILGTAAGGTSGALLGTFVYLILAQIARRLLTKHHRRAIRYCKRQEFEKAIPEFENSLQFFSDHQWVDRYRALTIFSAAEMSYREMGLVSLGFCYAQVGDGESSRRFYEQCLREYPENGIAMSAVRLLDAGSADRSSA